MVASVREEANVSEVGQRSNLGETEGEEEGSYEPSQRLGLLPKWDEQPPTVILFLLATTDQ